MLPCHFRVCVCVWGGGGGGGSWTFTAELEKMRQVSFETRCYRRLLKISYKDHNTNEEVRRKLPAATVENNKLLPLVKKW